MPSSKAKAADLPPMSDLNEIFADIVRRAPKVKALAESMQGKRLRVATMCSGTESPLLALKLMCRAIEAQHGITLEVEHVFSCEIEPFKQAYIQRNFAPPILFNDVTELGNDQAHTAYGALADVPGDVHLLVAGTSCVDFSNLNNLRKSINDDGESGRTFRGMLRWVKKHKPLFVILENVVSAPWEEISRNFKTIGYDVSFEKQLDTKKYYIPQSRRRGYMCAVLKGKEMQSQKWLQLVHDMARPASSPFHEFLLPAHDPRVLLSRQKFVRMTESGNGKGNRFEWSKCQARHERAREEEALGSGRPFTNWSEGGTCCLLNDAWQEWGSLQPERVLDLLDITYLRLAQKGIDASYKRLLWELSQNVDRAIGCSQPGISTCIVPSGIPYLTFEGRPLLGIEALSLQGLPIEELQLTHETNDQLLNLAGNAMSSTVVGTCIIAALVLGQAKLAQATFENAKAVSVTPTNDGAVIVSDLMHEQHLHTIAMRSINLESLLKRAQESIQRCQCEGQLGETDGSCYVCNACPKVVCSKCRGRPSHELIEYGPSLVEPGTFSQELLQALPMRLNLSGVPLPALQKHRRKAENLNDELWHRWSSCVAQKFGGDDGVSFFFLHLSREPHWIARYRGEGARLECILDPDEPHWRLYIDAPSDEGRESALRSLLDHPVLRMKLNVSASRHNMLEGEWQLCLPVKQALNVQIESHGDLTSTWTASLGLQGGIAQGRRFTQMTVTVSDCRRAGAAFEIDGEYKLNVCCSASNGSLYRRQSNDGRPTYLFLEQKTYGGTEHDRFVFSFTPTKGFTESPRDVIAALPFSWRPPTLSTELIPSVRENIQASTVGVWIDWPQLSVQDISSKGAHLKVCKHEPKNWTSCARRYDLLCIDTLISRSETILRHVQDTSDLFREFAWMLQRFVLPASFSKWSMVEDDHQHCLLCAPTAPSLQWIVPRNASPRAIENAEDAGRYEQALKNRPKPFVAEFSHVDGVGRLRVHFNAITLAHRAAGLLPSFDAIGETRYSDRRLHWRLTKVNYSRSGRIAAPVTYTILSNKGDCEEATPRCFKVPLRKEQSRSLHWMLRQESPELPFFVEEEVVDDVLVPLGLRMEGKASRSVKLLGGVLADNVGYGKTCVSLALIASSIAKRDREERHIDAARGLVTTKATLVIVPPHLCKQWEREVGKFCGSSLRLIVLHSKQTLNHLTIRDVQKADVIIVSVSVYNSDTYFDSLSQLSAANVLPLKAGRFFDSALQCTLKGLRNRMRELQSEGASAVLESIKEHRDFDASQYATTTGDSSGVRDDSIHVPQARKLSKLSNDIWGLKSAEVNVDWRKLRSVPLEAYHWHRVIIDEFHYIGEQKTRALSCIRSLQAGRTWLLSGTPPRSSFNDIATIASFFNIHLGVHDDAFEAEAGVRRARDKSRTSAESFASYLEKRTVYWQERRQRIAQTFLNRFIRQNVAEIDEIPFTTVFRPLRQSPAERACYLELAHMIEALEIHHAKRLFNITDKGSSFTARISRVEGNDRDRRLLLTMAESGSPEEALVRQASHFVLAHPDSIGTADRLLDAEAACKSIVKERQKQRDDCLEHFERLLNEAIEQHFVVLLKRLFRDTSRQYLVIFINNTTGRQWGDEECRSRLIDMIERTKGTVDQLTVETGRKRYPTWRQYARDDEADYEEEKKLRNMVDALHRLKIEYWAREKGLRYFRMVRQVQQNSRVTQAGEDGTTQFSMRCTASGCDRAGRSLSIEEVAFFSICGHNGCIDCVNRAAGNGQCCADGCRASVNSASVVLAPSMSFSNASGSTEYGIKLAMVATLIQSKIPREERILLFVQYESLLELVAEALGAYGIEYVRLQGSASKRSDLLTMFQDGHARVLLLNIADESASGSNLTVANHVIFLSPLIANDQQQYEATMAQAKGRAIRYGQTRKVTIWRFVVLDTIDEHTLKSREKISLDELPSKDYTLEDDQVELIPTIKQRKRKGEGAESGEGKSARQRLTRRFVQKREEQ